MFDEFKRFISLFQVGIFRRVFGGPWSHSSVGSHRQSNLSLGPSSPPRERRPLRSVPSVGPQFTVDPEVLAKEYVEKEIKVRTFCVILQLSFFLLIQCLCLFHFETPRSSMCNLVLYL